MTIRGDAGAKSIFAVVCGQLIDQFVDEIDVEQIAVDRCEELFEKVGDHKA